MFEIGNSLREARLRRGVDFAQAEQVTKVRGKYLRALEDEQFEVLPSQTYVKGFLRTYAEYLGLDGQLYVDEYNSRFVAGDDDLRPRRSTVRPQRRTRRVETSVVLVVLALIAIVTIVVISAWKSSGRNAAVPHMPPRPAATGRQYRAAPALSFFAKRGGVHVTVHAGGPTGPLRYDGTVAAHDDAVSLGGRRFWVQIDTPEDLVLKVHGKTMRLAGHKPRILIVTSTGIRPA
jgi:hypothetical protein